jgi:hypothetical protein
MGLFSKLVKGFKNTIRGIGKAIKKVTKPIRKAIRKILKPFGRIYGKLGWVGTIALMFALPAMAGWMGTWFSSFSKMAVEGGKAFNWLTKTSEVLGNWSKTSGLRWDNITTKIKDGWSTMVGKEAGIEEITITATKRGAEQVAGKVAEQSWWQEHFGGKRIKAAKQWMEDRPLFGQAKEYPAGHELAGQPIPELWTEGMEKAIGIPGARSPIIPGGGIDPITGVETVYKVGDVLRTPTISGYADVLRPKIGTVGEVVSLGESVLAGQQIYSKYFKGAPDYTEPFYNANIGLSNAMLGQTETGSPYMDALQFVDPIATEGDSYTTLAHKFATGWGKVVPPGTNPVKFAMDLPGYGYSLEDYYWDTIYGDQETSDLYDPYSNA